METEFEELKRYVAFDEADARRLASFAPVGAPHFRRIATEFYERIREHEDAHAVFKDEAQITRLQDSLVRWMHRLCGGVYDEAYFQETLHIGHVHVRVGLPQRYMFTAMALIRVALTDVVEKEMGEERGRVREALTRLLDLELAIMLEGYRADFDQQVERLEKEEIRRTLARTEHQYRNAVELARALIVGLDALGAIRLFNREAERVTGFGRDEILGTSFASTLLPDELRGPHGAVIDEALKGKRAQDAPFESFIRTKAGKARSVRWQFAYAPSQASDEVVFFAIGQDTTDARALAERTRQSEKLAAVGTLAAGLAHEIRNPLNGAQLHVAFLERSLKRSGADPELLEAVGVVDDEIKRLAMLVTEFLDFARPKPLILKEVSVRTLCEHAAQMMRAQAEGAHVTLSLDLPLKDPSLHADAAKLEQVLLNLLQNAIEALTPGGGGRVSLRVRRQPRHLVIEVEDDGPGIENARAPIFDAFFSTKANGTGLGLSITHRIVTDHDGTIDFESKPRCTVFRLSLPLEHPE